MYLNLNYLKMKSDLVAVTCSACSTWCKRLLCLLLFLSLAPAFGHGESNAYHRLTDVVPCLDSRSVAVTIDLGESDIDVEGLVSRLELTLKSYITTTLSASLVNYKEAKTCPDNTLLQSLFDIRPSGYAGDPTLIFSSLTHVGSDVSTQEESNEDNSVYYSFNSSLEFVEDYPLAEDFKLTANKNMTLELVQNWWEDNPTAQVTKAAKPIPQILGISLSLLILIVGIYLRKRPTKIS